LFRSYYQWQTIGHNVVVSLLCSAVENEESRLKYYWMKLNC